MKVLIAGCGPVGMTLACLLRGYGHAVTVLDKRRQLSDLPRGIAISQASMALFDRLGIGARLDALGLPVPALRLYRGGRLFNTVGFAGLDIARPYFFHLTQNAIEQELQQHLLAQDIALERGWEVTALRSDAAGVSADCRSDDGCTRSFEADVLVGCDGGNSSVRALAGIAVDQQAYGGYFVLADLAFAQCGLAPQESHYFLGREGYAMVVPIPAGGHRVILSFNGAYQPERLCLDRAFFEAELGRRLPGACRIASLRWTTHSAYGHRIAAAASQGRIYLAGDALHQFSPVGGTNMNVGLQDAALLAQLLHEGRGAGYEADRQAAVQHHLQLTRYFTRLLVRAGTLSQQRRPFRSSSLSALLGTDIPRILTGHALPCVQD